MIRCSSIAIWRHVPAVARARPLLLAVAASTYLGCGGAGSRTYPVTGEVRYQGQPLVDAQVTFIPQEGQGRRALGTTNADGVFELGTLAVDDGALAGRHQVTITKVVPADSQTASSYTEMQSVIPPKYAAPGTSGLTANVQVDGENYFSFNLTD